MLLFVITIIVVVVVNKCHREIAEVLNEEEHVLLSSLYCCSLQKHISVEFDAFHDQIHFTKEFEKLESFLFKSVW